MVGSYEISSLQTITRDTSSFCQYCGMLFTEKWKLKEHKRVVHDERVMKCDYCTVELVGLLKMKAHKQKHKQKECKKFSLLPVSPSKIYPKKP